MRRWGTPSGTSNRDLEEMGDTFRDLHEDFREDSVGFKDMVDLGDPSVGVRDPFNEDMEVKGPLQAPEDTH